MVPVWYSDCKAVACTLPTPSPGRCWCKTARNCTAPPSPSPPMAPGCRQQPSPSAQPLVVDCQLLLHTLIVRVDISQWEPASHAASQRAMLPQPVVLHVHAHSLPWHADCANAYCSGAHTVQVQGTRSGTSRPPCRCWSTTPSGCCAFWVLVCTSTQKAQTSSLACCQHCCIPRQLLQLHT